MKLVLASFFQPEFHGPGRKIIISPGKPKNLMADHGYDCSIVFEPLSPGDLYFDYHKMKKVDADKAGVDFTEGYRKQLTNFVNEVKAKGPAEEVLPFKEGDTLLTWELRGNTSYRTIVAEFLQELGYAVEEN